jgi:uroporphyrinogen-III synthase
MQHLTNASTPRVIVTRPAAQAGGFVTRLQALGVDAVALPLIRIEAMDDPRPIAAAWGALAEQALVMFVSANAVAQFFQVRPPGRDWPAGTLAGATGPGTRAALKAAGVPAAAIVAPPPAGPHDTETLWTLLRERDWSGRRVLLVRGEQGRDWLATQLQAAGALLTALAAYRRLPPTLDAPGQALLAAARAQPRRHVWHFSSGEAVAYLQALDGGLPPTAWGEAQALATHPRIAEAARRAGFAAVHLLAVGPDAVAAWVASIESRLPPSPLS